MKIPRDLSGVELASLLQRFGYQISRQSGSHIRLTSTLRGVEHHVTIPAHRVLRVGTLNGILSEVASHLDVSKQEVAERLFAK